jgi:hypothetical protein
VSQADAGAGVRLAGVVTLQKRNKAARIQDNRRKKRAGNVSDDKAQPAPLGVKRAQRSAKKAETKERMPLVTKAGHTVVWVGAEAKAVEKIDSEESDNEGAQARKGADRTGKTPKKAEDQEAGVDARERVGRKTAWATQCYKPLPWRNAIDTLSPIVQRNTSFFLVTFTRHVVDARGAGG